MYIRQETADTFFWYNLADQKIDPNFRPSAVDIKWTTEGGPKNGRKGRCHRAGGWTCVTLKVAGPKSQEDKWSSHRYDTVW